MEHFDYNKFLEKYYGREEQCNREIEEAIGGEEERETSPEEQIEDDSKNEADQMISKLCRVCGNRGQIYIYSVASEKYLTIPKSRLPNFKKVTIAEMIEQISSEKVDKEDLLPQFICPHCLSYLQHAYNVRLEIIHTSNNLKEVRKIANDESISLEVNTVKPLTLNQQEIINTREETDHDKYWYENFDKKKAKIVISSPTRIDQRKATEMKCPGCFRKSYGAKSHNQHMSDCLINLLQIFFGEFQLLYKARFDKKITQGEYLISAISLIFNYSKKIDVSAKKLDIDISAVSRILPEIPSMPSINQLPSKNESNVKKSSSQDRFSSPADHGYFSNQ